jgi:hypothetical protein
MVMYSSGKTSSGKGTGKSTSIGLVVIDGHEIAKEDTSGDETISGERGIA